MNGLLAGWAKVNNYICNRCHSVTFWDIGIK